MLFYLLNLMMTLCCKIKDRCVKDFVRNHRQSKPNIRPLKCFKQIGRYKIDEKYYCQKQEVTADFVDHSNHALGICVIIYRFLILKLSSTEKFLSNSVC
jgi:hypothetical protein